MNWIHMWIYRLRVIGYRVFAATMNLLGAARYGIATVAKAVFAALAAWWNFRPVRDLLLGLPAIFALIGGVTLAVVASSKPPRVTRDHYQVIFQSAYVNKEWDRALIGAERVCDADPESQQGRYDLALACEKTGNLPRCETLMNQLAPRDQQGYAPAHLWIAAQILKAGTLTRESYDLAFAHLMRARQEPAQANLVDATLAELYLVSGRVEQARELLIRLPNLTGQQQLSLARTSALTGKVDNARREAAAAANMFAAQVKDEPNNSEARMHWAEACALSGQTEQAEVILRDGVAMSPKGPCSVALVRFYLQWVEMLARTPSPQNSRQILQILRRARTVAESLPSDNVAAMSLLAQINLQLNEPDKAEEYLKRAAPSDLASQVKYASLLGLRGKKEESVIQARQALQRGTLQLKENPSNAMVIAMTAEAAGILGDFAQSAALLEEGVKQLQNNQFDALLSRAYLAMYDKQRAAGGEASESIKLLRKSFERNPWDAAVLQRVLAVMKEKSSAGEQARAMVNERLAAGGVPGIAHMLIGTDALQAGDAESARKHLELAFQLEPRIGSIANNLAWTLLKSEPPDLSRALELVSQALKLTPNSPDCYDTRANIYMAMERWEDAVKDFEVVLRARPSDAKLHRSLAEAYRKLHMDDLAKRHDDAAVALEAGK